MMEQVTRGDIGRIEGQCGIDKTSQMRGRVKSGSLIDSTWLSFGRVSKSKVTVPDAAGPSTADHR